MPQSALNNEMAKRLNSFVKESERQVNAAPTAALAKEIAVEQFHKIAKKAVILHERIILENGLQYYKDINRAYFEGINRDELR